MRNEVQLKRTGPKEFAVRGECVLRAHFFLWRSRTLLRFISIGSLHLKDFKIMAGTELPVCDIFDRRVSYLFYFGLPLWKKVLCAVQVQDTSLPPAD